MTERASSPGSTQRGVLDGLRRHWLAVAFVVLVVVPLYLLMASVVVRSGLLNFAGPAFDEAQFRALIAFLGVTLGTAATVLGGLIAKANNDRAFAQQVESERRTRLLEIESHNRQRLDTAVQVLGLIKTDDGSYPGKAVTGGALTTLVHLGQPVIAMRTLESALDEDAVDIPTAVWLIDQVLNAKPTSSSSGEMVASKEDAVEVLTKLIESLPDDQHPGDFHWPPSAYGRWPPGLDWNCGLKLLHALLGLLTSRSEEWWISQGRTWTWVIDTLDQAVQEPSTDESVRKEAARYAVRLLDLLSPDSDIYAPTRIVKVSEVRDRMSPIADQASDFGGAISVSVNAWIDEASP